MAKTNTDRLVKVEVNQEHLMKKLDRIIPQIEEMHDSFIKGDGKISKNRDCITKMGKTLYGNGRMGLVDEVSRLKNKWYYFAGGVSVIVIIAQILIQIFL